MRSLRVKGISLKQLSRAFHISMIAKKENERDVLAIVEREHEKLISRRRFISSMTKAAAVIGTVGLYEACKPVNKKSQPVIAIIGGGIAGLHAAYILKNAGYIAQVYEGSPRTGGRIRSVDGMMGEGLWTEMGGEFIDSDHEDMLNLARHFELPLIDRRSPSEMNLEEFAYFFNKKHYGLNDVLEALKPVSAQIQNDIDSLSDDITFEKHSPSDIRLDSLSIAEYLNGLGIKGWFSDFINASYTAEYGLDLSEQSAINFLSIFDPGNGKEYKLYGDSDERFSVQGGNQKICDALTNELQDQVLEEHMLTAISQNDDNRYQMFFQVGGKGEVGAVADIVLIAIPFTLLREVDIKVPLPEWKTNAIKNLGYGTNSKLFVGVNNRIWRQQGYTGYAFSDTAMGNGYDHTEMQGNNQGIGGYTIFLGGKTGIIDGAADTVELQKKYVPALDQVFPGVSEQFNGNFQKWNWPAYSFSKGSYVAYRPGQYTTMSGAQFKPVGNLYFAGEHCSYEFQGFMNGGAETGRKAAELIITKLKS